MDKPNLNFIRAQITEPRPGYPPHVYQDFQGLAAHALRVIEWVEFLEGQLGILSNEVIRVNAERDSIRQAHTKLAASAEQGAIARLQSELEQAHAVIAERDRDYGGLEQAASDSVAAVQRVTALVESAESRLVDNQNAKGTKKTANPTFLLTTDVRKALTGPVGE
jgi:hypothetical protein